MKIVRTYLTLLFALLLAAPLFAQTPQNYGQVRQVPRAQVDAWLKSKIEEHGGDWKTGRFHFVIGLSTGHFGQDPVQAIAMRRIAFSLLNNSFAAGDTVTPVAWEMEVWKHGETVTLTESPDSRAEVVNEVPYAPRQNSEGGHDVERALFETLSQDVPPATAHSTIVILLTNTNQSQGPTGKQTTLFGADNSQLKAAIEERGMSPVPERKSFTLQSDQGRPLNVDVTALFPKKIEPLPNAPVAPRFPTFDRSTWQPKEDQPEASETLPEQTRTATANPDSHPGGQTDGTKPVPPPKDGFPLWIVAVVVIVLVVVIAALMAARKSSSGKPIPKPVEPPKTVTQPLPGSARVKLGLDLPEAVVTPLSVGTRYLMPSGEVATEEEKAKLPGETPLATLVWGTDGMLTVTAPLGAEFTERKGNAEKASDDRRLCLKPGEGLICRLISAMGKNPIRLELNYKKER